MDSWDQETVEIRRGELATLHDLAIAGYNAEIRFKSYKRFKGERPSEYAMRKASEKEVIEKYRREVRRPEAADPPQMIE